jgi:hypothetical protein
LPLANARSVIAVIRALSSRRLGAPFPCVHLAQQHEWIPVSADDLPISLEHQGIECSTVDDDWAFAGSSPRSETIAIDIPDEPLPVDSTEHGRLVKFLAHGKTFPYSREDMHYKLGRIHEMVERTLIGTMTPDELRRHANSEFFILCIDVVKNGAAW